ncbi:IclR family transcriptional regulator [Amycolatopsis endophytica]|uniref:IclR family acetate operon transcriptional repressor n=1 Tax=Amycolatopsis endophytica TaxID=860233 RepID=A0A853BAW0_9PSEU|nr:IclR family transcriptional regulator [Amycolatopsis endophytica]NYI91811.1 IclR family acetate operon transcriptional repressor [Amycolatopsis endophytica]
MTTTDPAAEPAPQPTGQPGTQTLIRGLRVLEALTAQDRPIGVGELSRILELPKSTVQRLLRTLEQEGWAQTSNGAVTRWQLSPRLLTLARRDTLSKSLREVAKPHLVALAARTGETIHFSVLDRDVQLVLIDRVDSIHPVRTFNAIGATTALHTSCGGKAVLAMLPPAKAEEILARPLEKVMPNTSVDPQHLMHQVLEARERGYAVNISENRANVCAVGAAVADSSGHPIAAVAISMPDIRFDPARVPEWGAWVSETARAITDALAH